MIAAHHLMGVHRGAAGHGQEVCLDLLLIIVVIIPFMVAQHREHRRFRALVLADNVVKILQLVGRAVIRDIAHRHESVQPVVFAAGVGIGIGRGQQRAQARLRHIALALLIAKVYIAHHRHPENRGIVALKFNSRSGAGGASALPVGKGLFPVSVIGVIAGFVFGFVSGVVAGRRMVFSGLFCGFAGSQQAAQHQSHQ